MRLVITAMLCAGVFLLDSASGQQLASTSLTSDPVTLSKAETALREFHAKRKALPKEWAVYARASHWELEQKNSVSRGADFMMLSANSANRSIYIVKTTVLDSTDVDRLGKGAPSMLIEEGGRTYVRKGTDGKRDLKRVVDASGKIDGTDRDAPPFPGPLDFFAFCLSDEGSFQIQKTSADIVRNTYMAPTNKLLFASESPNVIVGVWKVGQSVATVEFDVNNELVPRMVTWRFSPVEEDIGKLMQGRITSATRTNWAKLKLKDGSPILVPWSFQCEAPGLSPASTESDVEIICEWKFDFDVDQLIPAVSDESWLMKPIVTFNRDPHEEFAKFKTDVEKLYGSRSIRPIGK